MHPLDVVRVQPDADNIYLTATGERQIQKVTPDKKVSVVAQNFEADPKLAKGPNDLVVAKNGTVYFTDPNGYYGDAPNGTVYWISGGKAAVSLADNEALTFTSGLSATLTATVAGGWTYLEVPDLAPNMELVRVVRSDGVELGVGDVVWRTDRTFKASETGATRENLIHLLDKNSTGSPSR